jgi:hypothetical protein
LNHIRLTALIIALSYCCNLVSQDHNLYLQNNEINSLIFDEKNEMAISITTMSAQRISLYNVQMGYNLFKHLNISAAFSKEYGARGYYKGKNTSYTFSVGTNHKLLWAGDINFDEASRKGIIKIQKGINFVLNLGYSINHLNNFGENSGIYNAKDIRYNSLFAKLGFSYDYDWGNFSLFSIVNFNKYKYLRFTGTWIQDGYAEKVSNYFEDNDIIRVWSINFHNEMGRRMIKFIFGMNITVANSFGSILVPRNKNDTRNLVYIGTLFDLDKMGRMIKRTRNNELKKDKWSGFTIY